MLSNSIAAIVRVTPSPNTLAESNAVFRKLKDYGQVRSFIRAPAYLKHAGSSLYYAVIANASPTLHSSLAFNVPVYHDLPDPKDEDPFNIRGLQDRKPYPKPATFACILEQIYDQDRRMNIEANLRLNNPYTEEFRTVQESRDDLQTVLRDTKAPLPAIRGLGRFATLAEGREISRAAAEHQARWRPKTTLNTVDPPEVDEPSHKQVSDDTSSTFKPISNASSEDLQEEKMPQFQVRRVDTIITYTFPKRLLKKSKSRGLRREESARQQ